MQIVSRNTNTLAPDVYELMKCTGVQEESRNGPVLRIPEPVLIGLTNPWERVNFCPERDANPFFHLIEACAMLANVNNAPFLAHFASNMLNYSDDGLCYNSFYGTRLFSTWGNQLNAIIENLKNDPASRQEVALIWNPADLRNRTKDKACNLALLFSINPRNGCVEMTSLNRSNDAIWGMVNGANIVHLSLFQEYVACALGRNIGNWWHLSNNLHVYVENPKWPKVRDFTTTNDPYKDVHPNNLVALFRDPEDKAIFDLELRKLMEACLGAYRANDVISPEGFELPFIKNACWVFNIWQFRKSKEWDTGSLLDFCEENLIAEDWRMACKSWLTRRG